MASMGHASVLLDALKNSDAESENRRFLEDYMGRVHRQPLPKLSTAYCFAANIDDEMEKQGKSHFFCTSPCKVPCNPQRMIPIRALNINALVDPHNEMADAYAKIDGQSIKKIMEIERKVERIGADILHDLQFLGVSAFLYEHEALMHNCPSKQSLIAIPRIMLEGNPEHPTEAPYFNGAITMLAYLLHKNLVSENDIPGQYAVSSEEHSLTIPFSRYIFKFAQSVGMQNKIRAAFDEPLLPEEKRNVGIDAHDPRISFT